MFLHKQELESWKLIKQKKNESDPSLLLKLENLKGQVKFLKYEKLLLKKQLDKKAKKLSYLKRTNTATTHHVLHTKI